MSPTLSKAIKVVAIILAVIIVIAAAAVGFYAHNESAVASEYNQTAETNYYDIISRVRRVTDNADLDKISIAALDTKITSLNKIKNDIDTNSLTYYDSSTNLVSAANNYIDEIVDEYKSTLSKKIDDAVDKLKVTDSDTETAESLQTKIDDLNTLKETLSSVKNVDTSQAAKTIDKAITKASEKLTTLSGSAAQETTETDAQADDSDQTSTSNSGTSSYYSGYRSTGYTSAGADTTASAGADTADVVDQGASEGGGDSGGGAVDSGSTEAAGEQAGTEAESANFAEGDGSL
jgi:myosin heavy subunit